MYFFNYFVNHIFFSTESFKDFKLKLHKIFPVVYDTKLVAFEISRNPVSTWLLIGREVRKHSMYFDLINWVNIVN